MKKLLPIVCLFLISFAGFGQNWRPLVPGSLYQFQPRFANPWYYPSVYYEAIQDDNKIRFSKVVTRVDRYSRASRVFCQGQGPGFLDSIDYYFKVGPNQMFVATPLNNRQNQIEWKLYPSALTPSFNVTLPTLPGVYRNNLGRRFNVTARVEMGDSILTYTDTLSNIFEFSKSRGLIRYGSNNVITSNKQVLKTLPFTQIYQVGDTLGYIEDENFTPFGPGH